MNFIDTIKSIFRKGGAALGMANTLNKISDDPRIATNQDEVDRIKLAMRYYAGSYVAKRGLPFNTISYFNSQYKQKYRNFNAVNVTQMCAKRLASICLNSGFTVSIDSKQQDDNDSDTTSPQLDNLNNFIQDWLERSGVNRNLESKLEQGIPTGGFAIRPYVDENEVKVSWVRANQFFSLNSNTEEISQAAIASKSVKVVANKRYYYTLLEFHEWNNDIYKITNELYKSDNSDIAGQQVPLGTDDMFSDILPEVSLTGYKRPMFVYFKCPGQNNIAPESPLGVGFVNNAQNILDAINYAHDSFVWEMRMGKRKVMIPGQFVKAADEFHEGTHFDPDQDVYMPLSQGLNSEGNITPINPDIRVQDYQQMMQYFLNELENAVGLSTGTFSQNAQGGIATATQVVSENSMTYQTRQSYLNRLTKFITELIYSVIQIAQTPELFDGGQTPLSGINIEDIQVSVHYDDGVFVDKDAQAKQDLLTVSQGAMPKKMYLIRNYGLSEKDAEKWLEEVQSEAPEAPTNESPFEQNANNKSE